MYKGLTALLAAIGRAAAGVPFPITGLTAALLSGLMLARPRRLWKPLLSLVLSLSLLWLPLYANTPYALAREATDTTLSALIESLAQTLEPAEALSHEEILQTAQTLSGGGVRLKFSRFSEVMRALHIAGFYSPLTGEALLSEAEPEWFLPFVACHELAHANGLANEGQANLRAYALCMSSDSAAFRNSARLYAMRTALSMLDPAASRETLARLPEPASQLLSGVESKPTRRAGGFLSHVPGRYEDLIYGLLSKASIFSPRPSNPTA